MAGHLRLFLDRGLISSLADLFPEREGNDAFLSLSGSPSALAALDLNRLILEMNALLRFSLAENIRLRLHLSSEPLPVSADAFRLRRWVMELICGAADSLKRGEGMITLASRVETSTRAGEILFHDTGEAETGSLAVLEISAVPLEGSVWKESPGSPLDPLPRPGKGGQILLYLPLKTEG